MTAPTGATQVTRPAGIHPTAVIGEPPESRDWYQGDPLYPPTIDPTARLNAFVTVDAGLSRPTRVGARSFLMAHVHVGHDCLIGDGCELAPHAALSGWVELGDRVKIGTGASIKPRVKIGDGAQIGTGAVVVRDVPAGEVWVGNPARRIDAESDEEVWNEWWNRSRYGLGIA